MMKIFQMLVFTAVAFANIHWQITPNGYLGSLIAIGVTLGATHALLWVIDTLTLLKRAKVGPAVGFEARRGRSHHRVYQGPVPPPLPRQRRHIVRIIDHHAG